MTTLYFLLSTSAMATKPTSPAENQPRSPNADELRQITEWLLAQGYDKENAEGIAADASAAVFDNYCTDSPGYAGKLMSVVWSGSESFFDVFTWEDGKMVRGERDYDEKECDRCGAKNGTLCWDCWRQWSDSSERPEEKIRRAMRILHQVANEWDHDGLVHYPKDMPSFDEYLADIGTKLYAIRFK